MSSSGARSPGAGTSWADIERDLARPEARREPRCAHFAVCGGCDLQHLAYAEQLRLKGAWLRRILGGLVPPDLVRDCLPGGPATPGGVDDAPWGFRRKVHFVFGTKRGRLVVGHYARGGRDLVAVRECPAHAPEGNRLAFQLRDALGEAGIGAWPDGPLRHVVVRVPRPPAPAVVTLVVSSDGDSRIRRVVGRLREREGVSVAVSHHDDDTPYVFGRQTRHVAGPRRVQEEVHGLRYQLSPTSFFQTNVDAADRLVDLVLAPLARERALTAVDLYAGVGLFALQLAAAGHRVLAIEENGEAVADGLATARALRLGARCRFVRASVRRLDAWTDRLPTRVDLLVLDPPREGVGGDLLRRILSAVAPARVAYISCDPVSLARDLAALGSAGAGRSYGVREVQPVDMFPHTAHLESLVWLERRRPVVPNALR